MINIVAYEKSYANPPFSSEEVYYEVKIGNKLTNSEVEKKKEEIKAQIHQLLKSNYIEITDEEIEAFINSKLYNTTGKHLILVFLLASMW